MEERSGYRKKKSHPPRGRVSERRGRARSIPQAMGVGLLGREKIGPVLTDHPPPILWPWWKRILKKRSSSRKTGERSLLSFRKYRQQGALKIPLEETGQLSVRDGISKGRDNFTKEKKTNAQPPQATSFFSWGGEPATWEKETGRACGKFSCGVSGPGKKKGEVPGGKRAPPTGVGVLKLSMGPTQS